MNWYLVILLVTTSIRPGAIHYPMPNAHVLLPPYATEDLCKADGPRKVSAMSSGPGTPAASTPVGKKYVFTCVQIP